MCGRYLITSAPEALRRLFRYLEQPNFPPRYNIAPTQPMPIVRVAEGERHFALVRWGLVPPWVKDPRDFSLLINARGETVNEKPAFRNAMKRRRCLIPADGFYEWKAEGGRKRPFVIRQGDGEPMAFAGLWETWMGPNGEEMETAAIITTKANRDIAHVHDRMPVIVPPETFDFWLDCNKVDAVSAAAILVPARLGLLEAYEVSTAVNRVANDTPALLEQVVAQATPELTSAAATDAPAGSQPKRARKSKKDDRQSSLF
jgi:putative SOS response-associated peptidase YedK